MSTPDSEQTDPATKHTVRLDQTDELPAVPTSVPPEGYLGRHAVTGELGAGGMNVVLQVWDEQIGREMGGAFTNRREFTGKNQGPIKIEAVADMTDEQIDAELERLWGIAHGDEPVTEKPIKH